jgi:hypothetical protein
MIRIEFLTGRDGMEVELRNASRDLAQAESELRKEVEAVE